MNRGEFIKRLGFGIAATTIPMKALSKNTEEFDIDKWEKDITNEINIFKNKVDIAYTEAKMELSPVKEFIQLTNKYSDIVKYCTLEEDLPLSDTTIDDLYISLLKYEFVMGKGLNLGYRKWLKEWQNLWMTCGDEFMKKTRNEIQFTEDISRELRHNYLIKIDGQQKK